MPFVKPPEYTEVPALKNSKKFKALMDRAIELRGDMAVLEGLLNETKEELDDILVGGNVEGSVTYKGWRVQVINKVGPSRIDKKKLLALLGPTGPKILKQALIPGSPSRYVQISAPTVQKEGDNDESEG
jgi:hypothetical protein